ncbi:MAG: serine--tRNA ligase, partial [Synergistaceae bacterium]|nr:serine--tRNA ligase [Synergistaceae bacterium]
MLDIKYILANMDEYAGMLKNRKHDFDLGILTELDAKRRKIIGETEDLKAKRNEGSKRIGMAKNDPSLDVNALKAEIKAMGDKIKELDTELADVEEKLHG